MRRRERRVEVGHTAASSPWLLRQSLLALHHLAIDLVEVDLADLVNHVLVVECDKSKAPVTVRHLVIC